MAVLFDSGIFSVVDATGAALAGATIDWYTTGTASHLATYSDNGLTTPNANPVVADANGRFPAIYLQNALYKMVLKTAAGVTLTTRDPISGSYVGADLAANGGAALVGTSTGRTVQQELNAPTTLAADTGATLVDHKYAGTGATKRTLAAIINNLGLNVFGFGAVGDNSTNDLAAFNACLAQCKVAGVPMIIPSGYTYKLDGGGSPIAWDPTKTRDGALRSIPIIGGGDAHTVLNVVNSGARGLYIYSTTDWFDFRLEGLTIKGAVAGPLLTIGKDDYSDPVNMMSLYGLAVENSLNNAANEAVRFNYITGGEAINLRANSYSNGSGTNVGSAIRLRQAEFLTFIGGAAGNADRGVDITDGVNFGLTFMGQTYENSNYCFSNRSASSGGFSVIGAQFSNVGTYPIYSSGILGGELAEFIGCNFQPAGLLVDPANYFGVRVHDSRGITAPAVPASTVAATNTSGRDVMVFINGGNVTGITVNGSSRTYATNSYVFLKAGGALAITYTVAPTWAWESVG